ncbi:hypothetical protein METEAL_01500 [Mesoterricola silvestris]|uniref:Uncharacterized protein n=1 Tax=Mesoterricola silvestris TaxID=2927979 RepID=A0AA48GEC1_9BACT|nr:hypothetical protein METEAL_01500 [Mesoterricola silvestris]
MPSEQRMTKRIIFRRGGWRWGGVGVPPGGPCRGPRGGWAGFLGETATHRGSGPMRRPTGTSGSQSSHRCGLDPSVSRGLGMRVWGGGWVESGFPHGVNWECSSRFLCRFTLIYKEDTLAPVSVDHLYEHPMRWLSGVSILLLAAVGIYLLDRFGLWMERRGWIYWRKNRSKSSVFGSGAMALQDIFQSGKATHVIEAKDAKQSTSEKAGPGPT